MNRNVMYITSTRTCFGSCASRRSRPRQSSLARRARSRSRSVVRSHLLKIRLRRRARAPHHPAEIHRRRRRRRRRASSSRFFAGDRGRARAVVAARSSSVCSVSLMVFAAPAMRVSISHRARGRSDGRRAPCVWSVCTPRVHETTPPPPPIVAHARARCCCCSRPRRGTRCSRSRTRRSSGTRRCERRAVTTTRRDATRRESVRKGARDRRGGGGTRDARAGGGRRRGTREGRGARRSWTRDDAREDARAGARGRRAGVDSRGNWRIGDWRARKTRREDEGLTMRARANVNAEVARCFQHGGGGEEDGVDEGV